MASTYRDRSAEFRSRTQTLRCTVSISGMQRRERCRFEATDPIAFFHISQKISRLAQVVKQSSIFNDPTVEIQELTTVIKNEITVLNSALADLQTLWGMEMAGGVGYTDDNVVHCNAFSNDLKARLLPATKRLKQAKDLLLLDEDERDAAGDN